MGRQEYDYMPVSESLTNAEVNPLQEILSKAREREEEFDPEKISENIARALCEPTEELYQRSPRLKKDPIAAIKSVKLVNSGEEEITDPVNGLLLAAAKLDTAVGELNLSPKQKETFNGFKENIHGAAAFLKSIKATRGKAARALATGTLIVSQALVAAGCSDIIKAHPAPEAATPPTVEIAPSNTPFQPETPIPQITPTETQAPTLELTPTKEVVPAYEPRVLLSERIEYEGLGFDFAITMDKNDKYANDLLEKYWIEGLAINENKPNARELLAKVFAVEFLETYNFQNNANISLEEYISNPDKYPVTIVMRDENRELKGKTLTLDQINSFELRVISSNKNGDLYMSMPKYGTLLTGYGFEDNKFILITNDVAGIRLYLESNVSSGYDKGSDLYPHLTGYIAGTALLGGPLGQIPYTVFRLIQHQSDKSLNIENIYTLYDETVDWIAADVEFLNAEEYKEWARNHDLFLGIIK